MGALKQFQIILAFQLQFSWCFKNYALKYTRHKSNLINDTSKTHNCKTHYLLKEDYIKYIDCSRVDIKAGRNCNIKGICVVDMKLGPYNQAKKQDMSLEENNFLLLPITNHE